MSLISNGAGESASGSFYNGVITSSLRFNEVSDSRLDSPSFASDGGDTWTWSAWVKLCDQGTRQCLFGRAGNNAGLYFNDTVNTFKFQFNDDGAVVCTAPALRRDPSAWYHVAFNGNGTINKLWVNGVEQTFDSNPNLGKINEAVVHKIGFGISTTYSYDGQMADVNFVDGTALDYTAFAEFKNGILIPKEPSVTYGDNGFRLQFKGTGTSANSSGIGADTSGNDSHFTVVNLNAHDVLPDNPENNFCTMNPLVKTSSTTAQSEGNLKLVQSGQAYSFFQSTFSMRTGKWYAECRVNSVSATIMIGISEQNMEVYRTGDNNDPHNTAGTVWYLKTGAGYVNGSSIAAGTFTSSDTYTDDDVIGIALDLDSSTRNVMFFLNGTEVNSTDLSATGFIDDIGFANNIYNGATIVWNFGQDSTHNGEETATTNADDNGIGAFHHAPPSGFLAVCSSNLEEPTIGPNSDTVATDNFNTVIYTGDGSNNRNITGYGFQVDWIWVKERNSTSDHRLHDSARGAGKVVRSSSADAELVRDEIDSFISDGFHISGSSDGIGAVNQSSSQTYVAWGWKANAGTATATISEGGDNPAAVVQANPTAGFSLITYTGTGDAGTIAHGLGAVPQMMIIKNRDAADAWAVYHSENTAAPATDYLVLNTTAATADAATYWADTAPTSSVFTVHDAHNVNADGEKYVAYVFASISGYSKFGRYKGNANDNGAYVYLGFKPAWIMIKSSSSTGDFTSWVIYDNKRTPFNDNTGDTSNPLYANNAAPEGERGNGTTDISGNANAIDFLSNGFKLRDNADEINSAETYIYMAFADQPIKYANAE